MKSRFIALFTIAITIMLPIKAFCAEGGYSNYLPGLYGDIALAMAPPDGVAIKNDSYFYFAQQSKSVLSGELNSKIEMTFSYNYTTLLYNPVDTTFLAGEYAMGITVNYGGADITGNISVADNSFSRQSERYDLGDLTLAPILLYWHDGNFHYSFSEYIVIPTADYSSENAINSGLNYWTLETDVALTYFNNATGQDYSLVLGYNYNTENKDTHYQTGQEVHIDIVLNQFLSETFAVGIQAFHLQQITKDQGKGAILGAFKAQVSGLGPSISWLPKKFANSVLFSAKWLKEFNSKNRLEGEHAFVSLTMTF